MAVKKQWNFKLKEVVRIRLSGETGTVEGRAHYVDSNPSYYIAYKAADGRFTQAWIDESQVFSVSPGDSADED